MTRTLARMALTARLAASLLFGLVPKLQFGNLWLTSSSLPYPVKQELQTQGSQAGAWEPANSQQSKYSG
jgi:hypothetical protein